MFTSTTIERSANFIKANAPTWKRAFSPFDGGRPYIKDDFEARDGWGFARIAFVGEETVAQVIFGAPGSEPILGAVALENVGVVVDPVSKTLKRLHAKPLK